MNIISISPRFDLMHSLLVKCQRIILLKLFLLRVVRPDFLAICKGHISSNKSKPNSMSSNSQGWIVHSSYPNKSIRKNNITEPIRTLIHDTGQIAIWQPVHIPTHCPA